MFSFMRNKVVKEYTNSLVSVYSNKIQRKHFEAWVEAFNEL